MKSGIIITAVTLTVITFTGYGQGIVGKLKQKAAQVGERTVEKKIDEKTGISQPGSAPAGGPKSGPGGSSAPTNTTGEGLVVTPPNVKESMAEAEVSFRTGMYSDARYALRQAMLGVEMEIGNQVLNSLPESVVGLPKKEGADQVTSMGYGWVGLTIYREYASGDKQLSIAIANNSAWMAALNMYLTNPGYSSTGQQNWKQIKVKGYKGIIEFNEGSGYKVSVPIGQTSLIMWEGINFATEQDIMNAANAFDIDAIKNKLGEK
ncbi:MAG: hypothetical protein MUC73_00320 [Cyclobacteriaceae bacterium]|jgi:hypothetical protein|nr:hypothetical protein [Cyclobacteriaceae bacterium]